MSLRTGTLGECIVCVAGVEGYSSIRSSTQLHLCKPHTEQQTLMFFERWLFLLQGFSPKNEGSVIIIGTQQQNLC